MPLSRNVKSHKKKHVLVLACADDACAPENAVRAYFSHHGMRETIPNANIHRIRNPGGVHSPQVFGRNDPVRTEAISEFLIDGIRAMIEMKEVSVIFIGGHNPCGGCNRLGMSDEAQKIALVAFGEMIHQRFGLPTVVLFEEHSCDHHDSDILAEFGEPAAMAIAAE